MSLLVVKQMFLFPLFPLPYYTDHQGEGRETPCSSGLHLEPPSWSFVHLQRVFVQPPIIPFLHPGNRGSTIWEVFCSSLSADPTYLHISSTHETSCQCRQVCICSSGIYPLLSPLISQVVHFVNLSWHMTHVQCSVSNSDGDANSWYKLEELKNFWVLSLLCNIF